MLFQSYDFLKLFSQQDTYSWENYVIVLVFYFFYLCKVASFKQLILFKWQIFIKQKRLIAKVLKSVIFGYVKP